MKSIAISANTSWYLFNFRKNTILFLIDRGCEVYILAPKDEYSVKLEEIGAIFIHVDIDQGGVNPFKDLKTFFNFLGVYKRNSIGVVLNFTPKNNIYSTLASKYYNVKSINNIAGLGLLFINEGFSSKVARLLYRVSQPLASKIFFQNEEDKDLFLKAKIVPESLTERLPGSGVDLSRFYVIEAPNDKKVRFLLLARMLKEKGIVQYVEAARVLKRKYGMSVTFQLMGTLDNSNPSTITTSEMQVWVNEGVVEYLGTSDTVEKQIGLVDCVVLPSYYREGVPKSLLEAGAMGKPIVTTNNVGCRETVDNGVNGYLCIPKSSTDLAAKLEIIINLTHKERVALGLASRKKIEEVFDENIVINKYWDAINSL